MPCCALGVIPPAVVRKHPRPKAAAARRRRPRKGVDRISQLPDSVLGDIISLLPTKEGARTQILASSWRHLWRSAPVNLDCRDLPKEVVAGILSTHPGPGHRFCAPHASMDEWFQSPSLRDLQELELSLGRYRSPPASIFRFSATLRAATFKCCRFTEQGLHFPQLKQLTLEDVEISECSLHSLIAGCPALECFLVDSCHDFRCLRINSPSLRTIGFCVSYGCGSKELIVENAPCLERLLCLNSTSPLLVSVISAPRLETIGRMSDIAWAFNRLVFGDTAIQSLQVESPTTALHTVKILHVAMDTLSLDKVIALMRCFPLLEKLYIQASASNRESLWRLEEHRDLSKGLDIRLKTIVMECYHATSSQVNFVRFFVLNAKVLELMRLRVERIYYSQMFLAQQHAKLQLDHMASRGAMLHFTTRRCIRNRSDMNNLRGIDLRDPFHRSCCQELN